MSGRRNVLLRADDRQELRREPPREPFELAERHAVRIAANAALRAPVRQAEERALPRHPHRERGALAERHPGVVADAALRGAGDARVLDAVPGEDDAAASVHPHRDRDDRRALGEPQPLGDIVRNVSDRNGLIELRDRHPVKRRVPLELGIGNRFGRARHGRASVPAAQAEICAIKASASPPCMRSPRESSRPGLGHPACGSVLRCPPTSRPRTACPL